MIHPTAYISSQAILGNNASVGAFSIIHENVIIGEDTVIDSHCEIGYPSKLAGDAPLTIGAHSLIRSHSIFYVGSTFGDNLVTGHRVTVRELTKAGISLQIGTNGDIQGHCEIGDHVRTQSNVYIAQKSKIGSYVWLFPSVVLTNDPHPPSDTIIGVVIDDYAAIGAASVVLPGIRVGEHALVASQSCVTKDVESHTVVGGVPAKFLFKTEKVMLRDGTGRVAYPWPHHFSRGYPEEFREMWQGKPTDKS